MTADDTTVLEQLLVGALLSDDEQIIRRLLGRLRRELFAGHVCAAIAETITRRLLVGEPIDLVDVHAEVRQRGVDITIATLTAWREAAVTHAAVGMLLVEQLEDRALQRHVAAIKRTPAAPTGVQSLRDLRAAIDSAPAVGEIPTGHGIADAVQEALQHLDGNRPAFLPTGLQAVDQYAGGLKPGDLIVVAARTGVGKTVLATRLAKGVGIAAERPVLYVSLEVGRRELALRLLADAAGVENFRLQRNLLSSLERERIVTTAPSILTWNWLTFLDNAGSWPELLATCARWGTAHEAPRLLVIDYLGLIRSVPGTEKRYQELGTITRDLKAFARQHQCVVVAVSQLARRAAEHDRPPQLTDLRESGDIEQDADVVLLAHAPTAKSDDERIVLEVIIAKNRSGRTGTFELAFDKRYCRIEDVDVAAWDTDDHLRHAAPHAEVRQ